MKTDLQLHRDVIDELRWEPSVNEAEIGVAVKDGVVTLSGFVETFAQKYGAERAVKRVAGVKAVAEELRVRLLGSDERSDTELAHAVLNALNWNIEVPKNKIRAKVENGWVTLEGEVDWRYQMTAATHAVRYLTGVRGVTNVITITPKLSPSEVKTKIESAFKRNAELDANQIRVETLDGVVTLRGKVRTWVERSDAERAAWNAPGVRDVRDELAVTV